MPSKIQKFHTKETSESEGIFEITHRVTTAPSYMHERLTTIVEGTITNVTNGRTRYFSTGKFLSIEASVPLQTSLLTVKNERGTGQFEFPNESLPVFEPVLLGTKVRYTHSMFHGPAPNGNTQSSITETLEFLEGPLTGRKLEGKIGYS
ncbi:MAG: hypothetical protein AABX11_00645 [Nanoarchaeota archaeon]